MGAISMSRNEIRAIDTAAKNITVRSASIAMRSANTVRRSCMRDENDSTIKKAPFSSSQIGLEKKSLSPRIRFSVKYNALSRAKSTKVNMPRKNCPYRPFLLTLRFL